MFFSSLGLIVNCFDLAVDRIPDKNDIGVESIVLFQQGTYKAGADQQTGGIRWHQGKITRVYQANDGTTLYDGCHTKTEADGKWVTYKGYSQRFTGLKLEELRNGANIFDVIDDSQDALRNVGGALSHARGEGGACEVVESGEQRRMQESIEAKSKNYLLNMESKLKEAPPNPQERTNAEGMRRIVETNRVSRFRYHLQKLAEDYLFLMRIISSFAATGKKIVLSHRTNCLREP